MTSCDITPGGRRRTFWTTQPSACGKEKDCGDECGRPGLSAVVPTCDSPSCPCCGQLTDSDGSLTAGEAFNGVATTVCTKSPCEHPRTIANNDYVRSLALNMLMTDARKTDRTCGYRPGAMNGHWSESYITNGGPIGTELRYAPTERSIADSVNTIKAYITATMQKLITYGVALSVEVTAVYKGGNKMAVNIVFTGRSGEKSNVGISGTRMANSWAWD